MKISLCVICKNEEEKIGRCIDSVKNIINEMVIVDTGSTDKTIEIAKSKGAQVYEIEWENDFAKARNYAISKATGDWIIFLDADEYFSETSQGKVREVIMQAKTKKFDAVLAEMFNLSENSMLDSFKTIRIFRKAEDIYYTGKIHELVERKDKQMKALDACEYIKILHDGYMKSCMESKEKGKRNIQMLMAELELEPYNSKIHFYLMQEYCVQKNLDKVIYHFDEMMKYDNCDLTGVRQRAYDNVIKSCRLANVEEAKLRKYYDDAIKLDGIYPDFDYQYGLFLYSIDQKVRSSEHFERCLDKVGKYKGAAPSGAMSQVQQIMYILGVNYMEIEEYQKAVGMFVKILRVNSYHARALVNLISLISGSETAENIGGFLLKLYDFGNTNDQYFVLKVIKSLGKEQLYQYLCDKASKDVKNQVEKEQ